MPQCHMQRHGHGKGNAKCSKEITTNKCIVMFQDGGDRSVQRLSEGQSEI